MPGRHQPAAGPDITAASTARRITFPFAGGLGAVEGILDLRWPAWFDGMPPASDAADRTTITGPVADQAALHGLLAKVRDLGLPLLTLRRIGPP